MPYRFGRRAACALGLVCALTSPGVVAAQSDGAPATAEDAGSRMGARLLKLVPHMKGIYVDKWKAKKVWRAGRDSGVVKDDEDVTSVMTCMVLTDAGMLDAAGRADFTAGRRWADAYSFYEFAYYFFAGANDVKWKQTDPLLSQGLVDIRSAFLSNGVQMADNADYCLTARDSALLLFSTIQ